MTVPATPPARPPRHVSLCHGAAWLVLLLVALVLLGTWTASPASAQGEEPEPCPEENPNCGDPSFPPPPVPPEDPPGDDTGDEDDAGDDSDADDEDDSPFPPFSGGGGFGDPLWFLPPAPEFEFAYDQQNYDLWLSQCGGAVGEVVEDVGDNPLMAQELPTVFWELYGDAERSCPDEMRASSTVLNEAIGGDVIGRADIPTGNYDIGYDEGAWNHWRRKLWGNVTDGIYTFSKWLTGATINLLDWAFGFDLATRLSAPANAIASGYYVSLNGSAVSAYDVALFITMFYFAFQLLRGRTSAAVGELIATYLIYAAFIAFVVLVPGGFGRLVTDTTEASGNMAASIAGITLEGQTNTFECPPVGGPDAELGDVVCPFGKGLHTAFVERPYDILNWGTDLGSGGDGANDRQACAVARDQILLSGPHGASDTPRFIMGIAGCEDLADFNHDPTSERAGLAMFVMITAILVLVLAALTALTLIGAQILLIGLIIVMPFAVVAGLIPGSGRVLLWRWVAAIVKVMMTVIAIAVFLSLYLVTILLMLEATAGDSWLVQGGSLVLLTMTMFWVRSRLLKASKQAASHAGDRMSQARIGGGSGGFFTAAGAGFAAGGRGRYIPYEVRSAYNDARRVPGNAAEWNTNRKTRSAVRSHNRHLNRQLRRGADPASLPTHRTAPPRGFTASRRARSGARIARQHKRASAAATKTAARRRVDRKLTGAGKGR